MDLSRRDFILAGVTATVPFDVTAPQVEPDSDASAYDFQGVALLIGPESALPDPEAGFFDNKIAYAYLYEATSGNRFFIRDGDSEWTNLVDPADRAAASFAVDTAGTVTGSGDGAALVELPTTLSDAELFSSPRDGILRYDGGEQARLLTIANASVSGANTTFELAFAVNGLPPVGRTATPGSTTGAGKPEAVVTHGKILLQPDDELAVTLENTGGTDDLDIEHLLVNI